jgi:hypothetical protein
MATSSISELSTSFDPGLVRKPYSAQKDVQS